MHWPRYGLRWEKMWSRSNQNNRVSMPLCSGSFIIIQHVFFCFNSLLVSSSERWMFSHRMSHVVFFLHAARSIVIGGTHYIVCILLTSIFAHNAIRLIKDWIESGEWERFIQTTIETSFSDVIVNRICIWKVLRVDLENLFVNALGGNLREDMIICKSHIGPSEHNCTKWHNV